MIIMREIRSTQMTANNPYPFAHWMLREIYEQPATLSATIDHYVQGDGFQADTCASALAWLASIQSKQVGVIPGMQSRLMALGPLARLNQNRLEQILARACQHCL